jgi:hypothetical protein
MRVANGGNLLPGYDMIQDVETANDGDGRDPDPSDPATGSHRPRSRRQRGRSKTAPMLRRTARGMAHRRRGSLPRSPTTGSEWRAWGAPCACCRCARWGSAADSTPTSSRAFVGPRHVGVRRSGESQSGARDQHEPGERRSVHAGLHQRHRRCSVVRRRCRRSGGQHRRACGDQPRELSRCHRGRRASPCGHESRASRVSGRRSRSAHPAETVSIPAPTIRVAIRSSPRRTPECRARSPTLRVARSTPTLSMRRWARASRRRSWREPRH